jgi:hypothetical protein
MAEQKQFGLGTRLLACVCVVCPICIFGRLRPTSRFTKWCNKMRYRCPCCKARAKVLHISIVELLEPDKTIEVRHP